MKIKTIALPSIKKRPRKKNTATDNRFIRLENNKTYIGIYHGFASVTKPVKIIRFSVDGSGNVGTPTTIASWSATLDIQSGTNTVNAYTASGYEYLRLMIFEEGQTIDTA